MPATRSPFLFSPLLFCFLLPALLVPRAAALAATRPESVPRLVDRQLDTASYVELARQWRAFMEENGESVEGLVNLGLALDYSGEEAAALELARRTAAEAPDDPRALTFLGRMIVTYAGEDEEGLEVLRRSRRLDPDDPYALELLATVHVRRGEFGTAEEHFRTMFERGHFARPLLDFAYNLLVDLPENAVLVTSGDNDTFPVWGLQAGRDFRRDVLVVNRSLLELPAVAKAALARRPGIAGDFDVDAHEPSWQGEQWRSLANAFIDAMAAAERAPVYVASSAMFERMGWTPPGTIDGLAFRASGPKRPIDEAARAFLLDYRLDSATDWTYPWSLRTNHATLMRNYVAVVARMVQDDALDPELRTALFREAEAIADFHDFGRIAANLAALKAQWAKD